MTGPFGSSASRAGEAADDRYWTDRAANYGWDIDATPASQHKVELVNKYLRPDSCVCDVGCGNGIFLRVLAPLCAGIIAIDLNAGMLAEARAMVEREHIGNAEFIQCRAEALPLPDAAFDLVYCSSALPWIKNVDDSLAQMIRILRGGGHLFLDVAGRNNLSSIYWRLWYRRRGHFGLNAHAYPAIKNKLEALGCRIVESHALGFCDQWKYIPGLHRLKRLERVFHATAQPEHNLDYKISNLPGVFRFANRWYIVARKEIAA